ncbi:methyltransferase [Gordonia sp. Z-3]|uniref:Methyltransferase n=1 Tax=Gordonia aquimaris TaxID=2984863 RepID=A0A9X3D7C8_9ACTN|nr:MULTISPECIES: methyltransferase [Gordonia]MCX2966500.1 methyltransferase [Gordonia aquimaris]MED5799792.1 methyltransferase [Gordonia sp. Z-3]
MTMVSPASAGEPAIGTDVYLPQEDTALLIDAMDTHGVRGARVLDLCTGTGAVAIAAAAGGAREAVAVDSSHSAVEHARAAACAAGRPVTVRHADLAAEHGRFEVVTCNPPYVPTPTLSHPAFHPAGPAHAWDAGVDGRAVLDPLCRHAPTLLTPGGTLLVVQSEFAGVDASIVALEGAGLAAQVIAERWIPFGPVLTARARWLEQRGLLEHGRRIERLVVIAARAPDTTAQARGRHR